MFPNFGPGLKWKSTPLSRKARFSCRFSDATYGIETNAERFSRWAGRGWGSFFLSFFPDRSVTLPLFSIFPHSWFLLFIVFPSFLSPINPFSALSCHCHWRWIGQTIRKFWLSTLNLCMWSQTMMFSTLIIYTIHMMSLHDHNFQTVKNFICSLMNLNSWENSKNLRHIVLRLNHYLKILLKEQGKNNTALRKNWFGKILAKFQAV